MNSLKTPAVRCCIAAPVAALAMALASPIHAGTVTLGTSGWEAHWDASLDGKVDIDFIAYENGNVLLQTSPEFTRGAVFRVFPSVPITFRQVGASTASHIVIDDDIITNSTGTAYTGLVMKAIDHG